jgi:hypothetical protein
MVCVIEIFLWHICLNKLALAEACGAKSPLLPPVQYNRIWRSWYYSHHIDLLCECYGIQIQVSLETKFPDDPLNGSAGPRRHISPILWNRGLE